MSFLGVGKIKYSPKSIHAPLLALGDHEEGDVGGIH